MMEKQDISDIIDGVAELKATYCIKRKPFLTIKSSKDAEMIFRNIWNEDINHQESFYILYLNRANKVIGSKFLSLGTNYNCAVDIGLLLAYALLYRANGIICAHNHPSGNLNPSENDIVLAKNINAAAKYHNISLIDNLILGDEGYLSFKDDCISFAME